jgi:hypothetical protein
MQTIAQKTLFTIHLQRLTTTVKDVIKPGAKFMTGSAF